MSILYYQYSFLGMVEVDLHGKLPNIAATFCYACTNTIKKAIILIQYAGKLRTTKLTACRISA